MISSEESAAMEPSLQKRSDPLQKLYSVMQSHENKLGGGEGIEGIYGSITRKGMQKIFDKLHHNCGFDQNSVLVDVGAGLGRPMLHAMFSPGVKGSFGIELDHVKVQKAKAFMKNTLHDMKLRGSSLKDTSWIPNMHCCGVEKLDTLEPATHAYSFWEGIPTDGRIAFGKLFNHSRSLRAVAVVQRAIRGQEPAALMEELGFGPLLLITSFSVNMSGSGASFQAYVFSKVKPASAKFLAQARGTTPSVSPLHQKLTAPLQATCIQNCGLKGLEYGSRSLKLVAAKAHDTVDRDQIMQQKQGGMLNLILEDGASVRCEGRLPHTEVLLNASAFQGAVCESSGPLHEPDLEVGQIFSPRQLARKVQMNSLHTLPQYRERGMCEDLEDTSVGHPNECEHTSNMQKTEESGGATGPKRSARLKAQGENKLQGSGFRNSLSKQGLISQQPGFSQRRKAVLTPAVLKLNTSSATKAST
ncbi:hypothetical protein CEUSTIGMA_g5837.t1 [Chlamydomonas eustigma]|uniref:DOT1 domain-containing protein n=1 Tax=Chlamydomonas eustigma TaxID=1157962 RepID=A0A250X5P1_9CHLO|nr:hypothetical protein CEUSTIGMA_g5837.t1 [Chlamydomonas eustigma]|eukprot:GAX78395.1 hypothetical protein CEUSTIGMA_g5837.t1 [Chlamydomonas eustigma]